MYTRIVVPLDGSELAERAIVEARRFSDAFKAPIHLVRAVDLTGYDYYGAYGLVTQPSGVSVILEAERGTAETYLSQVAYQLAESGYAVSTEVREGPVRRELQATLREGDLLVMASHGRGGLARWFLGSVAEDIVRHATVPVLIVRTVSPATTIANLAADQIAVEEGLRATPDRNVMSAPVGAER